MKKNYLLILLLVLLGLLGIILMQRVTHDKSSKQNSSRVELRPEVSAAQVSKIQIVDGGPLTMVKDGETWKLAGTTATGSANLNMAKIKDLLGILNGIPVELVSQNKDRQDSLGITDDKAKKLVFYTGDQELYTLLVSATNTDLIRQKGKENVYRWSSMYSRLVSTDSASWVEPTPVATEAATPSGVTGKK